MKDELSTSNEQLLTIDAVVLANGEYPASPLPLKILAEAPYVVCCDGGADEYIRRGQTPDVIIGDGDSLSDENRRKFGHILHRISDQETNDQTKAVNFLLAKGKRRIAIIGATGKREDHTLGNISLLIDYLRAGADVRTYTDYGIFIPCRGTRTFPSHPGQQVSIINFTAHGLHGKGLVYPLSDFTNWWQGTLNECTSTEFTIEAEGEYLVFVTTRHFNKVHADTNHGNGSGLRPTETVLPQGEGNNGSHHQYQIAVHGYNRRLEILQAHRNQKVTEVSRENQHKRQHRPRHPVPLPMQGIRKQGCIPAYNGRHNQSRYCRTAKDVLHHRHYPDLFQQFLAHNQVNGKDQRAHHAEHVARKRIVRQVITALRKDAQQRTAKTQRYADYLHQRSLFVQEKDRYQKDPNGLHGVEDGTGNRSRLTDAQQIAEHEPVESESSQTEQPYPLPPCDRCLLYKPACYPKCHGSKDTTHRDTCQCTQPQREQKFQSIHIQPRHDARCNHTEIGFQFLIFHQLRIFPLKQFITLKCFKEKGDNVMAKVKEEQSSQQTKQVLAFSTRLRHDLKKACRQLDEGEGQEDVTISKEVEAWLNK